MPSSPTAQVPGFEKTGLNVNIARASPADLTSVNDLTPQIIDPVRESKRENNGSSPSTLSQSEANPSPISASPYAPEQGEKRRLIWLRAFSIAKGFVVDQYFLLGFGVVILVASQVQVPASEESKKELATSYLCISIIFLITGCSIPTPVLLQNASKWKIHLFVQAQSYLLTSLIPYVIVSLCATNPNFMDGGLLIGMLFMGCTPTTISSNIIMTRRAGGNEALTTVESTLGNFLGPFLTPVLLQMYTLSGAWYTRSIPPISQGGGYGELYRRVFKQLGLSLFLPMAVGQGLQNLFPGATRRVIVTWKVGKLSSVALLVMVWQTYDQAFSSHAFESVHATNMIFIVFISIAFFLLWTATCVGLSLLWLGKKDTIAIAYCVPAKSIAMAVPISMVLIPGLSVEAESKLQIPIVIFQGLQIAAGSLLTPVFRSWVRRDETGRRKMEGEVPVEST
jgi:solute carrier family 10 (sodium/bile acid cotransporter), member 7